MSVVRKFKNGGVQSFDQKTLEEYQNFIAGKLNEGTITAKALPIAQTVASQWYEGAKSGLLNNITFDPINSSYSINTSSLPEELAGKTWEGSADGVNTNLLGQYTIHPDKSNRGDEQGAVKKYNTLLANWTNEFLKAKKSYTSNTSTPTKVDAQIDDLGVYVRDKMFGSDEAFQQFAGTLPDNEATKKWMMKAGVEYLDYYKNLSNTDQSGKYNYKSVDPAVEASIRKANETGDWTMFLQNASRLNWLVEPMLKQEDAAEKTAASETEKLNSLGIYDEGLIGQLGNMGFSVDDTYSLAGAPEGFSDWLRKQNATLFKNKHNQYALIKDNKQFDYTFEDPDAPFYGTYFNHSKGFLDFKTPTTEGWDRNLFKNPLGDIYGKRTLEGSIDGYDGWTIEGWPDSGNTKDTLGNTDYTKHLTVRNPSTNEVMELFRQANGIYKDSAGKIFNNVNINKYSSEFKDVNWNNFLDNERDIFKDLGEQRNFNDFARSEELIKKVFDGKAGQDDIEPLVQVIKDLRYKIRNGTSIVEREKATRLLDKLTEKDSENNLVMSDDIRNRILNYGKERTYAENMGLSLGLNTLVPGAAALPGIIEGSKNFWTWASKHKKGGILKAQNGTSFDSLVDKYKTIKQEKQEKKVGQAKDKIGTIGDMGWNLDSGLKIASGLGTVASFVPGVGIVGGAVMTSADLIRDALDGDGKMNWGNHLMNLGFTGLSAIGLGGLKGLKMASQATKVGDKVFDLKSILSKADEIVGVTGKETKLGTANEKVSTLVKTLSEVEKTKGKQSLGKLGEQEATKIIEKISKNEALTKEELSLLRKTKLIKDAKGSPKGEGLESLKKDISELVQYHSTANPEKIVKTKTQFLQKLRESKANPYLRSAGNAVMVAQTLPAASSIYSDAKEGGIWNIKTEDVSRVGMGLASGAQWYRRAKAVKGINKYTKPISETKGETTVSYGDKSVKLAENTKVKNSMIPLKGKKINESRNSEVEKALKEQYKDITDDEVKAFMENKAKWDVVNTKSTQSGKELDPESLKKPGASLEEFKKIKKLMEKDRKFFKEGGILKYQNPAGPFPKYEWPNSNSSPIRVRQTKTPYSSIENSGFPPLNLPTPWEPVSTKWNPILYNREDAIHQEALKKSRAVDWSKVSKEETPTVTGDMEKILAENRGVWDEPLKVENWMTKDFSGTDKIATVSNSAGTNQKSYTTDPSRKLDFSKFLNMENVGNSVMYLNTLWSNRKMAGSQINALQELMVNSPLMSRQHLRVASPYTPLYATQAAKMNSTGRRLQESTADLDKGFGARLSASSQASDLMDKGMQLDMQNIQQGIGQQIGLDRQTDATNLQISSGNLLRNADARSKVHLVNSNKIGANNAALSNYIGALHRTKEAEEYKQKYKNYYAAMTDPEYRETSKSFRDLLKQEREAKANWEKAAQNKDAVKTSQVKWEDTDEYKGFKSNADRMREILDNFRFDISTAQLAAQMPVSMKSGGSLEEKEYLLRLRHQQAKELKEEKEFFDRIIKNNELMLKSLIKIFK